MMWGMGAVQGVLQAEMSTACARGGGLSLPRGKAVQCFWGHVCPTTRTRSPPRPQFPQRRPSELSNKRMSKKNKTVNRAYGGNLSHSVVKERWVA